MQIHNQICNIFYYWTERRTWKSKRKSPGSFPISLAFKRTSMSSNKNFLAFKLSNIFYMRRRDWSNPFPFHDRVLQDFIPRMYYNYRIENRAFEKPAAILFTSTTRKKTGGIPPPPVGLSWDSPRPPPESVRTDGRTLTSEPNFFGWQPHGHVSPLSKHLPTRVDSLFFKKRREKRMQIFSSSHEDRGMEDISSLFFKDRDAEKMYSLLSSAFQKHK